MQNEFIETFVDPGVGLPILSLLADKYTVAFYNLYDTLWCYQFGARGSTRIVDEIPKLVTILLKLTHYKFFVYFFF